jgi:hypothetical protein
MKSLPGRHLFNAETQRTQRHQTPLCNHRSLR